MQIIFPGQHPMIGAIVLLFLIVVGLIGLTLLFFGIRVSLKKSNKKNFKFILIGLGSLMIVFVLFNWINYNVIHASHENKFIGMYMNKDTEFEFNLRPDKTWESNYEGLECDNGHWDFIMTEDVNYLEMKGNCGNHLFIQIINYDDSYIEFGVDQNWKKEEPVLRYMKEN